MSRNHLSKFVLGIALVMLAIVSTMLFTPSDAQAGIYNESADTTYQETWIVHQGNFTGTCNVANNRWFAEPQDCEMPMTFDFPFDIANVDKVEIFVDLWRNRDFPTARFRINDTATVYTPNVGTDWGRTPYIHTFDGSELAAAGFDSNTTNTIIFYEQRGEYHIHDVAIRVYSSASDVAGTQAQLHKIVANGVERDPYAAAPGTDLNVSSDQLQISAEVTGNGAKFIEFHAYYDGYDDDADGEFVEWHNANNNNWNPGAANSAWGNDNPTPDLGSTINIIDKVEVTGAGIYTGTWDLPHIVSQSGVRFKVRVIGDDHGPAGDYYNVRDAAGGDSVSFDLTRPSRPSMYFTIPGFEDFVLHHEGLFPDSQSVTITLPNDLDNFDSAYLVNAFYSNLYITVNDSERFKAFADEDAQGRWDLAINNNVRQGASTVDLMTLLQPGENTLTFEYWGVENPGTNQFGSFVEEPGPMIVLKRENNNIGADNDDPELYNESPENDETLVPVDTNISFYLVDTGVGMNNGSITMEVNNVSVTPVISVEGGKTFVFYDPPTDFGEGETVEVDIVACDFSANCLNETISFFTEVDLSQVANTEDFNVCTVADSSVGWTFVDPVGDSSFTIDEAYEQLEITVPAGTAHDPGSPTGNSNDAARLMQPAVGDVNAFVLEAKFDSEPQEKFQIQGILIEEDANNYLRFDMFHDDLALKLFMGAYSGGSLQGGFIVKNLTNIGPDTRYLRVVRNGDIWEFQSSEDGQSWTRYPETIDFEMTVNNVGVYAANAAGDTTTPGFTAVIDYFKDFTVDFDGEEDGEQLVLPVNITGQGDVTKSNECGKPLTLTAVETTPGWTFSGWSGAITSTDNPVTINDWEQGDTVTALFITDEYTVDINIESYDHLGNLVTTSSTATTDQATYEYGDTVTVTAVPAAGYSVSNWSGAGLFGTDTVQTFVIEDNETITVEFTQDKYDINIQVDGNGDFTIESDDADGRSYYIYGDEVTLTAIETGPPFRHWTGTMFSTDNPYTFSVIGDTEITAVFNDTISIFLPLVTR